MSIRLEDPPYRNSPLFLRYQTGDLFTIAGDFDGDGNRDLLVQDRPDSLAIHRFREGRISPEPDIRIDSDADRKFAVADINGDGRSDIIQRWMENPDADQPERTVVFYSREVPDP